MQNRDKIPEAQLLDYLSRTDDLLIKVLQKLDEIENKVGRTEFILAGGKLVTELETKRHKLFDNLVIRDTDTHLPDMLIDLQRGRYWGFNVRNNHDQQVTVELISGSAEDPRAAGQVGVSATINANTTEPIATDIWQPYLGVSVSYSVAPTSGHLWVEGWVQEA